MTAKTLDATRADTSEKKITELESVIVRFAGDSGDGMQLAGTQFTFTSAIIGNDIGIFPDYPAEIRAPAGTLPGVSGFQVNISSKSIRTPGDHPMVLVAMNPAALKVNYGDIVPGGLIIVNEDAFNKVNLDKAGYSSNPIEDSSLNGYQVIPIPITTLTINAVEEFNLPRKDAERCKNFFALGVAYWLFDRPLDTTNNWIKQKFKKNPEIMKSNLKCLQAGYNYALTFKLMPVHFKIERAKAAPGTYRTVTGNEATAMGFLAAAVKSKKNLFYGSYPITPASDVLHFLSKYKNFNARTFQAEDEIAAVGATIGAAYAGDIAVTGTSGPGLCLKSEAIGLAVMTELPIVILNVQRGGPSTGLPTKTEQADLLQSLYGRNGESPLPVLAASSPADCFYMAFEAVRLAVKYMVPVILLTDGYLANGAEPWLIPASIDLPEIPIHHPTDKNYQPYSRDDKTLSRPWALPGTPGLEHRLGGLEKSDITGNVSYDPDNHERMVKIRAEKVRRVQQNIPPTTTTGAKEGELLIIGWGSTYGAITTAVERSFDKKLSVGSIHLKYLNPLPPDLGDIISRYKKIIVAEMNLGQLIKLIREQYLVDAKGFNKVKGKPVMIEEIEKLIEGTLK